MINWQVLGQLIATGTIMLADISNILGEATESALNGEPGHSNIDCIHPCRIVALLLLCLSNGQRFR
jgi:hypothetical protein